METIAKPQTVEDPAQRQLRLRVFPSDARHPFRPFLGRQGVDHGPKWLWACPGLIHRMVALG
jgi:hypothetical protein